MTTIVTHTAPDWDAIGACWLLQRYGGMADASVVFVNTGNPDRAVLDAADAVVDTGREYDPARLRFDHHHFSGSQANQTCATAQVYDHLCSVSTSGLLHLRPLIDLIYAGDTGRHEADQSRATGIHALLSAKKARRASNDELLAFGYELLDLLADRCLSQYKARLELASKVVYQSSDGLVVAIKDGSPGSTFAAYEDGARLVLFQSSMPEIPTNAIGLMRGGENQEPHAGNLINDVQRTTDQIVVRGENIQLQSEAAIAAELATWYRHEAGFFAGRGTAKAPDARPIVVDLAEVAQLIDRAWRR